MNHPNAPTQGQYYILQVGLSVVCLIWYCTIWSVGLLGCWSARRRYRSRPSPPLPSALPSSEPGVSILRPLKGLDANISENLESSFKQDYPNFEILLSVSGEDDEALPVAHELIAKYPNVNARVIIGNEEVGVNPKINNLIRPYAEAAHDIVWILDSNIAVAPGTLARAVHILSGHSSDPSRPRRRIALVHHVPFATSSPSQASFGTQVEEVFLNTTHAKMYIAINTIAVDSCVVGKSNLLRRSDLERLDGSPVRQQQDRDNRQCRGLAAFGRFVAEDNMIARALWHKLDLRHDLSRDVAHHALGTMKLSGYIQRRVRWIRVRKHMSLAAILLEPFTESVMLSAVTAMSVRFLRGIPIQLFLPAHFLLWLLVDLDVYASLAGHPLPSSKRWSFLVAWVVRELLAFPIWFLAIIGDEVEWRDGRYRVLRNGEGERVSTEGRRGIRM